MSEPAKTSKNCILPDSSDLDAMLKENGIKPPRNFSDVVSDPNNEPVKWVSSLGSCAAYNGSLLLTLCQDRHMPGVDGVTVAEEFIISARICLEYYAAIQVRDMLDKQIKIMAGEAMLKRMPAKGEA